MNDENYGENNFIIIGRLNESLMIREFIVYIYIYILRRIWIVTDYNWMSNYWWQAILKTEDDQINGRKHYKYIIFEIKAKTSNSLSYGS